MCFKVAMHRPAVLVTGGAKRIGATIVKAFSDAGWHVVIHHGQSHAEAQALAASLPSAQTACCNLDDPQAGATLVRQLAAMLPTLRVLVNCAAVFRYDDAKAIDLAITQEAMTVNAITPTVMAQAFLASTNPTPGRRIINLLDMKIANPNPDFFSYTMAKNAFAAAVRMLAMAQSYPHSAAPHTADRIYGLAPGAMLPSWDQQPEEHLTSGRMNLLERLTSPDELADAALFLAQGWLATGQTLYVDSGQHLLAQPRDVLYLARS
jgi:NAD(P)-dependent dehydrogenase (short-subunit alcohol dehydrogenase family)